MNNEKLYTLAWLANRYKFPMFDEVSKIDIGKSRQIAMWYDATRDQSDDFATRVAYTKFIGETFNQYQVLIRNGIKIIVWTGIDQPYRNSKAMIADVTDNHRLYVYVGGEMSIIHPLDFTRVSFGPLRGFSANIVFRAVHDIFGHAMNGYSFGPIGEENAWRCHSAMYSADAIRAMTSETRGQNSWVNFGPEGEHNRTNPSETIYAEQKAVLAPQWVINY